MNTVKFVKIEDVAKEANSLFESEKQKLLQRFPKADIEHIGGTSIPGAISKGDVDINIRVEPDDFEKAKETLRTLYEINQPDNWTPGFASFKDEARNLGIQLTVTGSADDYFVAQRNYLRNHPEKVSQLNALKEKFYGKNMDEYRKEKENFLKLSILNFLVTTHVPKIAYGKTTLKTPILLVSIGYLTRLSRQ